MSFENTEAFLEGEFEVLPDDEKRIPTLEGWRGIP
jgi:hypothetical protein